jgi:hypothetical protein
MKTFPHLWQYLAKFLLEGELLQIEAVEKIKTHILYSVIVFFENRAVYEIMSKNMVKPEGPRKTL